MILVLVFLFMGLVVFEGCAPTQQTTDVQTSGFLKDYSLLRSGGEGNPVLFYRNPKTDFRDYDKILVDRVTIWKGKSSQLDNVPRKDLQHLATLLEVKIIHAARLAGMRIVREPGPGVIRIRAAITEAAQSNVEMDIVTTAVPLPSFSKMATGTRAFVGKATIEGEMTDSVTGEVLMAGVDRRAGGRTFEGSRNPWDDVEKAFQYWSDRFSQRLCEERGGKFCVPAE